jgi:hypothetical protein
MRWQRMFCKPDQTGRIRKDGQKEGRNSARFRCGKVKGRDDPSKGGLVAASQGVDMKRWWLGDDRHLSSDRSLDRDRIRVKFCSNNVSAMRDDRVKPTNVTKAVAGSR